jgi:hypothetical protein
MKSLKLGATAIATVLLFAFAHHGPGSIKGTVTPLEAGVRAWAESATDTLRAPILNGSYKITNAKPGAYKIIIEARPPYRNIARDGLLVTDDQETDAGEIKLDK